MSERSCLAIILAAGEGTRMRSRIPKVMHKVAGLPLIGHVLAAARASGASRCAVVAGPDAQAVRAFVGEHAPDAALYEQSERLGTAHAVLAARREFSAGFDDVLVLYGDTPLITSSTLVELRKALLDADVVVLGFRSAQPFGYGRLLVENGRLRAIREERDASPQERQLDFCNAGVMAFRGSVAPLLDAIGNLNVKGEYYLTDLVELSNGKGLTVVALEGSEAEFLGVNTRIELAAAEAVFQENARKSAMAAGVTLIAPQTVWFSHDTVLARDVTVEPNVFFGPGVRVAENVLIRANSHIEDTQVASGAIIGPFARLRPGTEISANAHIGNFVEIKNALIGENAKVNHLTYIGDATLGDAVNVGAGTITCNYDGFDKHETKIGAGAFIGSNSALVAPVRIGAGAYIASGSVVTMDVPDDALAVGRGRQMNKEGWARDFRDLKRDRPEPD